MKTRTETLTELENIMKKYLDVDYYLEAPSSLISGLRNDKRIGARKLYKKWLYKKIAWEKEKRRLLKMYEYETMFYALDIKFIAGIDEAGRGPLAGPLVTAAVILPPYELIPGLKDSKELTCKARERLEKKIKDVALDWSLGFVSAGEIDKLGINLATIRSMFTAVKGLTLRPDHLIIDAFYIPDAVQSQTPLIKGDRLSASVAAASILAKTERDRLMVALGKKYPQYGFEKNKGYGTREHLQALNLFGPSEEHRRSFNWKHRP